ncbi:PaaI family thioesterase [Ruminococcus albus]|uniref:Phenylacetic acid degradation protein n=1 Tax=Ruminococcus albus SY3 TaxID=1341156 RepID=A0A011UBF0_RUMAL|nr:PaaI family thioesterase [Ruminococcus albus]EXM37919.1 phenylacetic acid degradation protein [Ruminococcus albus SY3]MBP5267827.1 PaaI family thioesterase [Ruminococcus sp.]
MKTIEEIREFFSHDLYAYDTGAYIEEVGDRYAKISLTLTERHRNAVGGVMGGVYFTIADFAFAVASNWQSPGTVSLDSDISFIGVPSTDKIYAETELVKDGRSVCTYIVRVNDGTGKPLAVVKTVGFHKT